MQSRIRSLRRHPRHRSSIGRGAMRPEAVPHHKALAPPNVVAGVFCGSGAFCVTAVGSASRRRRETGAGSDPGLSEWPPSQKGLDNNPGSMLVCAPWESRPDVHGTPRSARRCHLDHSPHGRASIEGATFRFRVTRVAVAGSG